MTTVTAKGSGCVFTSSINEQRRLTYSDDRIRTFMLNLTYFQNEREVRFGAAQRCRSVSRKETNDGPGAALPDVEVNVYIKSTLTFIVSAVVHCSTRITKCVSAQIFSFQCLCLVN